MRLAATYLVLLGAAACGSSNDDELRGGASGGADSGGSPGADAGGAERGGASQTGGTTGQAGAAGATTGQAGVAGATTGPDANAGGAWGGTGGLADASTESVECFPCNPGTYDFCSYLCQPGQQGRKYCIDQCWSPCECKDREGGTGGSPWRPDAGTGGVPYDAMANCPPDRPTTGAPCFSPGVVLQCNYPAGVCACLFRAWLCY